MNDEDWFRKRLRRRSGCVLGPPLALLGAAFAWLTSRRQALTEQDGRP